MFLGDHADKNPDKVAIIQADTGQTVTYGQLDSNSIKVARHVRELGVEVGQNIAFISENVPEVFEIYWAALRSGLYITGVNNHLTASEASYILTDCGARVLFVSPEYLDLAREICSLTDGFDAVYVFGDDPGEFLSYNEIVELTSDEPLDDQPHGVDMLYSSGTTGRPKGIQVPLSGKQVDDDEANPIRVIFGMMFGFGDDTVYYSCAPNYHAAPLRFCGIVNAWGGTVVLANRFDAEKALQHIQQYRVTHSQWVPTMFVRMLKLPPAVRDSYDVSSMKVAIHAAAPCPVDAKQAMIDWWGPILFEYYSSTEGNGLTFATSEDWLANPGTVGKAVLGVIHICDESGAELPVGENGMIYFERDETPFEYHNDPEKTAAAQHPEHKLWTTTGDIGHVDDEGNLFLTDRAKFMIISGGVNIYPQEVENALAMHPAILDVAVIGVPDDDLGEAVKAVVLPAPDVDPSDALAQEILRSLDGTVARYKIPRSLDFTDRLPRSATGKLVKGELLQRYS